MRANAKLQTVSRNPAMQDFTPSERTIGVIGGSGVYDVAGLADAEWTAVNTAWGAPSDAVRVGRLNGVRMAFLPRHGRGHVHTPTSVPYRANIAALKQLGVTEIVSISACGSFRDHMAPGDFVLVDQFIDRTIAREKSFFGPGCVAHVSMAKPVCPRLGAAAAAAAEAAGARVHRGGTYLAMEGPQFSTQAESHMHRDAFGCDVIGMTNMPEAKLAREAEMCYATLAMVTDYDSWRSADADVDVTAILKVLSENAAKAQATAAGLPEQLGATWAPCPHGCDRALEYAVITRPDARDPDMVAKLQSIAGRVLGVSGCAIKPGQRKRKHPETLGLNQRPLRCQRSALPLSYAPGCQRGAAINLPQTR